MLNIHPFSTSFSSYAVQGQGITGNTEQEVHKNPLLHILEGTTLSTFSCSYFYFGCQLENVHALMFKRTQLILCIAAAPLIILCLKAVLSSALIGQEGGDNDKTVSFFW